ncbi:arylsulfatase [Gilvimarinus chinensis]|uniref:arylsulfatase n=1 Tax=Gilvimarinus chinensis TaxID=396005 RepID=UPI000379BD32|nr:arylsulfatase [Gilvimarinus chinensis]
MRHFLIVMCFLTVFSSAIQAEERSSQLPNIVLIITDDQGWGDLSAHGNKILTTPGLDKLMNQGVRFDRFYASPVCSPTRASVLTGRHSLSTGVFSVTRGGEKMLSDETTLAEHLQRAGYRTGLFGKWHNGLQYPYNPNGQGFEEFYGFADGHITDYFDGEITHNRSKIPFTGYLPDRLTDKAIDFMAQSHQPFFTMLSFNTPHSPFELPQSLFDKYAAMGLDNVDASVYGMMENIDQNIERLTQSLEQQGKDKNTIIVYLSDNGPAFPGGNSRYNGHLKGWKGKLDEGGVRVPFVIWWPEKLPALQTQVPGQHIDILPTLLSLAGIPIKSEKPIHGVDLSPVLQQKENNLSERALFTHHFRNTRRPSENPVQLSPGAIRQGDWAAIVDHSGQWQLYNLSHDPAQKQDVSSDHTATLAQLKTRYEQWYKATRLSDYTPLPIPLGLAAAPNTELPAHEAEIVQEGVDYRFRDGWSHDWLISNQQKPGRASWPVEITRQGRYQITVHYSTPNGDYKGTAKLHVAEQSADITTFTPHVSKVREGKRLAETGEAPTQSWAEKTLTLLLSPGSGDLQLEFGQDSEGNNLEVKGLTIELLADKAKS